MAKARKKPLPKKAAKKADALKLNKKAEKAKAQAAVTKAIASNAKRANAALEKASVATKRVDDLRLTAAVELGQAKLECAKVGINFKKWCAENIVQAYETVRKLAAIGTSENPAQALEDLRSRTKTSAAKTRKTRASVPEATAMDVNKMIKAMPEDKVVALIGKHAKSHGLSVIGGGSTLENLQSMFSDLKKSEQMKFMAWASAEIGAEVTVDGAAL